MNDYLSLKKCNICQGDELINIVELPNLPLTGLYLPKEKVNSIPSYDNSFLLCNECGHGQLKNVIDMEILYDETYTHRSSTSPISTAGNDFFLKFLNEICGTKKFKNILEVGCNDLYLINKIQDRAKFITGIDPIWKDNDFQHNEKTKILGKFIHELEPISDFKEKPDLIISAHTFEHVNETYEQFKMMHELASEECIFIIEVPCLDTMMNINRYDQIFHQHLQYLSLSSMIYLINKLNCTYINHTFNFSYWGGTILFAFKKGSSEVKSKSQFDLIKEVKIKEEIKRFRENMINITSKLKSLEENVYGFGAAQMLPILAYHMETDLSFFKGIIDDNPERIGKYLPSLNSPIISVDNVAEFNNSCVFICALDSSRKILKRLIDLTPRKIINPISLF